MNVYTNFFYIIRTGTKEGVEDKKIKTAKKFECFNYLIFLGLFWRVSLLGIVKTEMNDNVI